MNVPISHVMPEYPFIHWHIKFSPFTSQAPPFWHGFTSQGPENIRKNPRTWDQNPMPIIQTLLQHTSIIYMTNVLEFLGWLFLIYCIKNTYLQLLVLKWPNDRCLNGHMYRFYYMKRNYYLKQHFTTLKFSILQLTKWQTYLES